jgi:hypothetical protein
LNGPTWESALGFTAEDLSANRAGRLGPHQIRKARGAAMIWIGVGVLFIVAMIIAVIVQLDRADHGTGVIILPVVLAVLLGGFPIVTGFAQLDSRSSRTLVQCFSGPVRHDQKARTWYAGESRFRGPALDPAKTDSPFYVLARGAPVCHVYVVKGAIVSAEYVVDAAAAS